MKKVYIIIGVIGLIAIVIVLIIFKNINTSNVINYIVSDEKNITITKAGTYVISGTAKNITIYVECGDEEEVKIVLENLSITNETMPVIYVKTADKVFITSNGTNTLKVTGTFAKENSDNINSVIFSKQDFMQNGTVTLNIESSANGITGKDDLKNLEEHII